MTLDLVTLQKQQLVSGLQMLGIELEQNQLNLLGHYLQLLHKWNKAYNLTAVRHPEEHVKRHILDSLAVLPYLKDSPKEATFLDVGTGPGLPGIPLAIALPETKWYLLDSNGKKTRFLTQCKMNLPLSNIEVVNSRLELFELPEGCQFDGITSRAFATLEAFVTGSAHLVTAKTRLYAMKGVYPKNEVSELPNNYKILQTRELKVPDCEGQRHLIVLTRTD